MREPRTTALILAAGRGDRFGASQPKQLMDLCGRPVFSYALHQHVDAGHSVIVVVSDTTREPITDYVDRILPEADIIVASGGETRRQSLLAAIDAIPPNTPPQTAVLLRNSASPNTPIELLNSVARGLAEFDGMQAYVQSHETAFLHRDGELESLYDQSTMGFTADPTGYRLELLIALGKSIGSGLEGDTTLDIARSLGARIGLIESPPTNIKITTPGDLDRVGAYMSEASDGPPRDANSCDE